MKKGKLLIALMITVCISKAQIIKTIAGNGNGGFSGDGGMATCAELYNPNGITTDSKGNLYIADEGNSVVRKVSPNGLISVFAGGGATNCLGDGGEATNAVLSLPIDVAVDSFGNVFIVDMGTHRIRKVDTNGIISTVAGNGVADFSGDGGMAISASLFYPQGIAVYSDILYIAEQSNRIRKIQNGIISTVAGTGSAGFSGDGGLATAAELNQPYGMTCDSSGNLYIADSQNNRIRVLNTSTGIINTIVGNGTANYYGDNGLASNAALNFPTDVVLKGTTMYISDAQNYRIRKVYHDTITTVSGNGILGYYGDNGNALLAEIGPVNSITLDKAGNIFISDYNFYVIRQINYNETETGKKEFFTSGEHVAVYPNPTSGILTIDAKTNEKINVSLTDETGKTLIYVENKSDQSTINLSDYKSGAYYLHLKIGNNREEIRKIVKSE